MQLTYATYQQSETSEQVLYNKRHLVAKFTLTHGQLSFRSKYYKLQNMQESSYSSGMARPYLDEHATVCI